MQESFYQLTAPKLHHQKHIALVSDVHDQPYQSVLSSLRRTKPDIILMAGDFVHGNLPDSDQLKMQSSPSLDMIASFAGIAPTYLSLGNHEWMLCPEDIDLIRSTGAIVLDNSFINVNGLVLGGLTSGTVMRHRRQNRNSKTRYSERLPYRNGPYHRQFRHRTTIEEEFLPDLGWLKKYTAVPGYHILLSHQPEYWTFSPVNLSQYPIELILSGHAHGGQIRYYSFIRRQWRGLFAPHQGLFPDYTGDLHQGPKGCMIISRGLSNTARPLPRLFNRKELVYITLIPENRS